MKGHQPVPKDLVEFCVPFPQASLKNILGLALTSGPIPTQSKWLHLTYHGWEGRWATDDWWDEGREVLVAELLRAKMGLTVLSIPLSR
jgi:hypothetical protein